MPTGTMDVIVRWSAQIFHDFSFDFFLTIYHVRFNFLDLNFLLGKYFQHEGMTDGEIVPVLSEKFTFSLSRQTWVTFTRPRNMFYQIQRNHTSYTKKREITHIILKHLVKDGKINKINDTPKQRQKQKTNEPSRSSWYCKT